MEVETEAARSSVFVWRTRGDAYSGKVPIYRGTIIKSSAPVTRLAAGLLALLACCFCQTRAADTQSYLMEKVLEYYQTAPGAIGLETNNAYVFNATVQGTTTNSLLGATLQTPYGGSQDLLQDKVSFNFKIRDKYDKKFTLDRAFPPGQYRWTIRGVSDGAVGAQWNLPDDSYPNPPQVLNYDEAQDVNTGGDFRLTWLPFPGGTAADFVQVRVEDSGGKKIWESGNFGAGSALNGTATSVLIPANLLATSAAYTAFLSFAKVVALDTTTYPGALGGATYGARTRFFLHTRATPTIPSFTGWQLVKARRFGQDPVTNELLPQKNSPAAFSAELDALTAYEMDSATLKTPLGSSIGLNHDATFQVFDFSDKPATVPEFDQTYPPGAYVFIAHRRAGGDASFIARVGPDYYPPIPVIEDLPGMQSLDTRNSFTVRWSAWPGGTLDDFVQLQVSTKAGAKVFETPNFGKSGALNGLSQAALVPAAALDPGVSYDLTVYCQRSSTVLTPVPGLVGFASRTKAGIATAAPDAKTARVTKLLLSEQHLDGAFTPDPVAPFSFQFELVESTSNTVTQASFTTSTGGSRDLATEPTGHTLGFTADFPGLAPLNAQFPGGQTYRIDFVGAHDGPQSFSFQTPPDAFPALPHIQNLADARQIAAGLDFRLDWDPFPGGTTADVVTLEIFAQGGKRIFSTGRGSQATLDGTSFSANVPRDTLVSNRAYDAYLTIARTITAADAPFPGGATEFQYSASTRFLVASYGSTTTIKLNPTVDLATKIIRLEFGGFAGRDYVVERSGDLVAWSPVATNTASNGGKVISELPMPGRLTRQFYRALLAN